MKSNLLKLSIFMFSMFFAQASTAQWGTKGNGKVTKSSRQVSGIRYIMIEDGLDLYLYMGGNEKLSIEADENLHDLIKTEVDGDKLHIYLSKPVNRAKALKIHLSVTDIEGVKASGGSDVVAKEVIKFDKLDLLCSGGSDIDMEVSGNELNAKNSGGSDYSLSGKVKTLRVNASGGSDMDATKLEAEECYIKATGGSDINVFATTKLFVKASGSSDVSYRGNPQPINAKMTGGSDLSHR